MLQIQISDNTIGQAVKGINIGSVRKLQLPLPGRPEQDDIAEILGATEAHRKAIVAELHALRRVKSALMQTLLTGELRVEPLP